MTAFFNSQQLSTTSQTNFFVLKRNCWSYITIQIEQCALEPNMRLCDDRTEHPSQHVMHNAAFMKKIH